MNEHIAFYLDHDQDVVNFGLICKSTYSAIKSHRCGIWRKLWGKRYDMPFEKTGVEIMMQYKLRSRYLRKGIPNFDLGQKHRELRAMERLRDIIVGTWIILFNSAHLHGLICT